MDLVRLLADDLVALLEAEPPPLIAGSTPEEWRRAHLFGRTATGLLGYHYWMADASPGRLARLLGLRASMMAAKLDAALDRGPVLVHAHNALFRRDKGTMRLGDLSADWWSAGAIVGARLGDGYAFLPTALGTIHHHGQPGVAAGAGQGRDRARWDGRCAPTAAWERDHLDRF